MNVAGNGHQDHEHGSFSMHVCTASASEAQLALELSPCKLDLLCQLLEIYIPAGTCGLATAVPAACSAASKPGRSCRLIPQTCRLSMSPWLWRMLKPRLLTAPTQGMLADFNLLHGQLTPVGACSDFCPRLSASWPSRQCVSGEILSPSAFLCTAYIPACIMS